MNALALVPAGEIGVIAAAGAAGVGEDQDALVIVHEGGGLGEIWPRRGGFRRRDGRRALDDAPRAAGDFGDKIGAEAVQDLVERALHRRQCGQVLDYPVAAFDRLARNDRVAVGVAGRARQDVAFLVAVEIEELRRERMAQVIEHIFARCNLDREIGPLRRRDLGEAAVEQGLVGRDDLQDTGVTLLEIARDGGDQGRAFHRRQQMIEEALLVGFKGRARRGFSVAVVSAAVRSGDIRGLQRLVEILVNDLEGIGVGVVDADLLRRQLVLDHLVFDALEGQ